MNATEPTPAVPPVLLAELRAVLENLGAGGVRDPEAARAALARIDRRREGNRRLFGEQNAAVGLIRQTRDGTSS